MGEVIHDRGLLREREWMQSQGIPISHSQLSLDKYLDRLSAAERQGLIDIIHGMMHMSTEYFRKETYLYAIMGVGTITYDDEYWKTIKEVGEIDPSKKRYSEKMGEDIDIMFCREPYEHKRLSAIDHKIRHAERFNSDGLIIEQRGETKIYDTSKFPTESELFRLKKNIKGKIDEEGELGNPYKNLSGDEIFIWKNSCDFRTMLTGLCMEKDWKFTEWSDHSVYGAHYFKVPSENVEEMKQAIVRVKGEQYGPMNMRFKIPGCRWFHAYIDDGLTAPEKIEYERSVNIPFSVIYRSSTLDILDEIIQKKNGTYVPQVKSSEENYRQMNPEEDIPF